MITETFEVRAQHVYRIVTNDLEPDFLLEESIGQAYRIRFDSGDTRIVITKDTIVDLNIQVEYFDLDQRDFLPDTAARGKVDITGSVIGAVIIDAGIASFQFQSFERGTFIINATFEGLETKLEVVVG